MHYKKFGFRSPFFCHRLAPLVPVPCSSCSIGYIAVASSYSCSSVVASCSTGAVTVASCSLGNNGVASCSSGSLHFHSAPPLALPFPASTPESVCAFAHGVLLLGFQRRNLVLLWFITLRFCSAIGSALPYFYTGVRLCLRPSLLLYPPLLYNLTPALCSFANNTFTPLSHTIK
ncbi:hypothetical protein PIB30_047780, partial [Stylosanthes scabra]|nr:hypothetical protein [Stylosanthes scabra]